MESWIPFVIGSIIFFYVQIFNRVMKLYLESEKTLDWNDFLTIIVPVFNEPNKVQV
jgi:hypothetical protein